MSNHKKQSEKCGQETTGSFGSAYKVELTQDMHLKMSKKIAQLTKVIYALHVKNDENDFVVEGIKEAHAEEMRKLRAESQLSLDQCRQKVLDMSEQKKQSDSLFKSQADAQAELERLRRLANEKESKLVSEYSGKLSKASDELASAKQKLAEQLANMDRLRNEFRLEKENAVTEIEEHHRQKMMALTQTREAHEQRSRLELETRYRTELQAAEERIFTAVNERRKLSEENTRIAEECEEKLVKAQAFFDNELQVLKKLQNASHQEQYNGLQEQYNVLKRDSAVEDQLAKKRINEVLARLSVSEEHAGRLTDEKNKLTERVTSLEDEIAKLDQKLKESSSRAAVVSSRVAQLETELRSVLEADKLHLDEAVEKSSQIVEMNAEKLQSNAMIKSLRVSCEDLMAQVAELEALKQNFESSSVTIMQEQQSRITALQKALDESCEAKAQLQHSMETEQHAAKQQQLTLAATCKQELEALRRQCQVDVDKQNKDAEARLRSQKQDLDAEMNAMRSKLEAERNAEVTKLKSTIEDLLVEQSTFKAELLRVESVLRESQLGLGSVTATVDNLRRSEVALREELEATQSLLTASTRRVKELQEECVRLREQQQQTVDAASMELSQQLQQQHSTLEKKWLSKLKAECERVRTEVLDQITSEKQRAMQQLSGMKEAELTAVNQSWEKKVKQLLEEISVLKLKMVASDKDHVALIRTLKKESEEEYQKLHEEILSAAEEYKLSVEKHKTASDNRILMMEAEHWKKLEELELRLRLASVEDLKAQTLAHDLALSALRAELETCAQAACDALVHQHQDDLNGLRKALDSQRATELDQLMESHKQELQVAKMALERSLEVSRQKDAEHAVAVAELQDVVLSKAKNIERLDDELVQLQRAARSLNKELELKGQEVLWIRSESQQLLRAREQEWSRTHSVELSALKERHAAESQRVLEELTQAQQLLKDRINHLQNLLVEADDRYRNRESRDEDIATIQRLHDELKSNEQLIKKLNDEKRYFQMELINRETNFNKVFNADPKVGLINPLNFGKQRAKVTEPALTQRRVSSGSSASGQRLEPLPGGSPLHDEKLNGLKPIPPTTKKFLY